MANDYGFGVSFMPNGDSLYRRQRPGQAGAPSSVAPVQEAIKILSLRVPRVLGANPMTSQALVGGGGGLQNAPASLVSLLQQYGQAPIPGQRPNMTGQQGVLGAPSPMAPGGYRPPMGEGYLGGRPPSGGAIPNVTIGASEPHQLLPMPPQPAPAPAQAGPEDNAQSLWELAQRQRGGMGRIAY